MANDSQHLVYVGPLSGNGVLDLGKFSDWRSMAGSIVDNGTNKLGSVTFGRSGTTAGFTPQANGYGYTWNSPISYGNGFGSNPGDAMCRRWR